MKSNYLCRKRRTNVLARNLKELEKSKYFYENTTNIFEINTPIGLLQKNMR